MLQLFEGQSIGWLVYMYNLVEVPSTMVFQKLC